MEAYKRNHTFYNFDLVMELFIKNMVCDRCIMTVKQALDELTLDYDSVQLGEVKLNAGITGSQFATLKEKLRITGFELLDDQKASLVNRVKSCIIKYIHSDEDTAMNMKLSVLLADKLETDYNYLSALFSSVEGITIEKYVILQRIERVKELLTYTDLVLLDIKQMDEEAHQAITGVKNHLTLRFATYLAEIGKPTWIRYVLVPGYTDQQEHLHQLGAFVKDMKNVEKIEIQPYHKLGKHKYEALGWQYQLEDVEMNTAEQLTKAKKILSTYGKEVVVN